jgi:hypothetical protein
MKNVQILIKKLLYVNSEVLVDLKNIIALSYTTCFYLFNVKKHMMPDSQMDIGQVW